MSVRFPDFRKRGLGAGLDLPWDGTTGFGSSPHGDELVAGTRAFLQRHATDFSHLFFSWQPRDRAEPRLEDYAPSWDTLFCLVPREMPRALHHTALNLASLAQYERGPLLAFTAEFCERYQLRWVNEDVGFWSLDGRAVPYPLPPLLTEDGLSATIANTRVCQRALPVPLVLEFPGFSQGASVVVGDLHAYDFFRALAEETSAPITLDVGHLLSYQWWRGRRGEELFAELERLPLDHCFELHLSGCEIVGDTFIDAHHGTLLEQQLALTRVLMERCPNLRAITYEDPRFDRSGVLTDSNQKSWEALRQLATGWEGAAEAPGLDTRPRAEPRTVPSLGHVEAAIGDYVFGRTVELNIAGLPKQQDPEAVKLVRKMVLDRRYRGTGGLRDWYPRTLAAWLERHPQDEELQLLASRFCASAEADSWREHPLARRGRSLEEALFHFFAANEVGDADVREEELLGAVVRTLGVTMQADFSWPAGVRPTSAGCVAITRTLTLHAVVGTQYLRGAVTPLIAELLRGATVEDLSTRLRIPPAEVALVHEQMKKKGLLAAA
jgi:uncharacterized protein (UPF0276 family)